MAKEFNFGEDAPRADAQSAIYPFLDQQNKGIIRGYIKTTLPELNRVQNVTLNTGATQFDVRGSDVMDVTSNAAVSITTISNGYDGQILTLIFNDANTTLVHDATGARGTINLGGSNFTSAANITVQLISDGTSWFINTIGILRALGGTVGGFDVGPDYIRDAANSFGLASTVTGADDVRFWAGDTFANRATAPFRVTEAGAVTATNITVTGGSIVTSILSGLIALTNLNIANRGWSQSCAFSVTDADTIAWGAGSLITADGGTTYTIGASNTGNMVAKTYIYLDIAVSTTAYQTTTTSTTAVGAGKILVAVAQNATGEATFTVLDGQGGQNIDAANIVANSITANEIAASTITGTQIASLSVTGKTCLFDTGTIGGFTMSATTLTATNLTLTSGAANVANIAVGTGSNLAGMNSGNAAGDIAFWAGSTFANRATAPFRVELDGSIVATDATINGSLISNQDCFGDGTDGAVTIGVNTTLTRDMFYTTLVVDATFTLTTAGYKIFARTSVTVNGTITNSGGNAVLAPGRNGANGAPGVGGAGGAGTTGGTNGSGGTLPAPVVTVSTSGSGGTGGVGGNGIDGGASSPSAGNLTSGGLVAAGVSAQSGRGGDSGGQSGGAGFFESGGTFTAAVSYPRVITQAIIFGYHNSAGTFVQFNSSSASGGCGGGGGGGGSTGAGGGGGAGGGNGGNSGHVFIASPTITVAAAGSILATGGNGTAGGNGGNGQPAVNAGGGGGGIGGTGGNGGIVMLIYSTYTNSGTVSVAGGAAGTSGTGGTGTGTGSNGVSPAVGAAGNAGQLIQLVV